MICNFRHAVVELVVSKASLMRNHLLGGVLFACGMAGHFAQAAVVFTNGNMPATLSQRGHLQADLAVPFANYTGYQHFTLSPGQNTVRQVNWFGGYNDFVSADDFQFSVFDSDSNPIGIGPDQLVATPSILQVDRELTGLKFPSNVDIYRYTAYIADLTLPASTDLWFGIVNDSGGRWLLGMATQTISLPGIDAAFYDPDGGDFYHINNPDEEFRDTSWYPLTLSDDIHNVPEPSALMLLGIGCIALWGIRRRNR
jgi:hypothetical protein